MEDTELVNGKIIPLINVSELRKQRTQNRVLYLFAKRMLDIFLSGCATVVLFPLFICIAIIIYIDDPTGSPLFVQKRCGLYGRTFRLYKFRSMTIDAEGKLEELANKNEMDGPVFKIKNDPRITRIGRLIRMTSIDELPQIINVLRGDMSIVGPRPPLPREVSCYNRSQWQRLSIKPGLTCFWQTAPQRNSLSFDEWVNLDIKYMKERNLFVDFKLVLKTLYVMFTCQGE